MITYTEYIKRLWSPKDWARKRHHNALSLEVLEYKDGSYVYVSCGGVMLRTEEGKELFDPNFFQWLTVWPLFAWLDYKVAGMK